jgi:hypothetical protein
MFRLCRFLLLTERLFETQLDRIPEKHTNIFQRLLFGLREIEVH